jgi:hypothetical protein
VSEGGEVGVAEGEGVSVKGSVAVACGEGEAEAVSVGAGGVEDSVAGFGVGVLAGTAGGVKLQANRITIHRMEKTSFRRMGKVCIPFGKNGFKTCWMEKCH